MQNVLAEQNCKKVESIMTRVIVSVELYTIKIFV